MSRQAISGWESGTSRPSTENLKKLSDLYGVPLEILLNDDKNVDEEEKASEKNTNKEENRRENRKKVIICIIVVVLSLIMFWFFFLFENNHPQNLKMGEILGEEVKEKTEGDFDIMW